LTNFSGSSITSTQTQCALKPRLTCD